MYPRPAPYSPDRVASMTRIGNSYDNAKVESFMKTLKQEEIDGKSYRNLRHATRNIGSFVEQVYNRQRLHSALDDRSPLELSRVTQRRLSPFGHPHGVFKS